MKRFALVFAALAAVLILVPGTAFAASPTATTGSASGVAPTSATVSGSVDLNGDSGVSCSFAYGTSTSYGSTASCTLPSSGSGTVTANLSSLTPGTTYHYQLEVYTTADLLTPVTGGDASFTSPSTSVTPSVAATAASAVGGSGATLNGSVNPENWSIDSCTFTYTTGSTSKTASCASTPNGASAQAVSAAVTGLASGAAYTYTLAITYGTGSGTAETSTTSGSFTTTSATILAPTNLEATSATLTGTVDPEGQSVSSCTFYYAVGRSAQSAACSTPASQITGTSPISVSADVTGLSAKTEYEDTVVLMTSGGEAFAVPATFTTLAAAPAPKATSGAATAISATSAVLHATVNAEGEGVRGCEFEWGVNDLTSTSAPGDDEALAEPCTSTPADSGNQTVTITLKGLAPDTKYYDRLIFLTDGGLIVSTTKSFTTLSSNAAGSTPSVKTPTARITRATVDRRAHSATFTLARSGRVTVTRGYECALATITKGKASKIRWAKCTSPKTYTRLAARSYEFWVRAGNSHGWGRAVGHRFTI